MHVYICRAFASNGKPLSHSNIVTMQLYIVVDKTSKSIVSSLTEESSGGERVPGYNEVC